MSQYLKNAVDLLGEIEQDFTVPKNIRDRIKTAMNMLEEKEEGIAVRADKALEELDFISDDSNLPAYTRTQIWQVVSLLESNE